MEAFATAAQTCPASHSQGTCYTIDYPCGKVETQDSSDFPGPSDAADFNTEGAKLPMIIKDRPTKFRYIGPGDYPAEVLEGSKEWLAL